HIQTNLVDPQKLLLIAIDSYDLLSRTTFDVSRIDSYTVCKTYIEKALHITRITSCLDGFHCISNTYYYMGGLCYKNNNFQYALEPLSRACDLLRHYLEMLLNNNVKNDNPQDDDTEDIKSKLCKRFEVLSSCYGSLGEIEVGKEW